MRKFYKLIFVLSFIHLCISTNCTAQITCLKGNKSKKFYKQAIKILHINENKTALIPNQLKEYIQDLPEVNEWVEKKFMRDSVKYTIEHSTRYSIIEAETIPFIIDSVCRIKISNELLKYTSKKVVSYVLSKTTLTKKFKSNWFKSMDIYVVDTSKIKILKSIIQYGNNFVTTQALSIPIFFNHNTYCLIAYSRNNLKGGSENILFKKINKKWVIVKRLCEDYY